MSFAKKLVDVQTKIKLKNSDGWLLYDFRKTNDLACKFLEIPHEQLLTRRFFYWIPSVGDPVKIVHRIESGVLDHLPGQTVLYSTWQELETNLKQVLNGCQKVAMEYSPLNALPSVSKIDAGTADVIRNFGVQIVSSADFLQFYTSVWSKEQLDSHLQAAQILNDAVTGAWGLIASYIKNGKLLNEVDVQNFLLEEMHRNGAVSDDPPICAVNAHSADAHYAPTPASASSIKAGDYILIDLWCKLKHPQAVYADFTRVGIAAKYASEKQNHVFSLVKGARDAAMRFLKVRLEGGVSIQGWEVDDVCRKWIGQAGFGPWFTHRTGHNIGTRDHGDGANIDNFETHDTRELIPGTCFSIEPGIYLPGEFGVRLEHNVFIDWNGRACQTSGVLQSEIEAIL